jgi:hypothetical protein
MSDTVYLVVSCLFCCFWGGLIGIKLGFDAGHEEGWKEAVKLDECILKNNAKTIKNLMQACDNYQQAVKLLRNKRDGHSEFVDDPDWWKGKE